MSNLPVEATEPDPATTSIVNDQTVNNEGGEKLAPTETDIKMAEAESEQTNGAQKVKEEANDIKEEETENDAKVKKEFSKNGFSKTKNHDRKPFIKRENRSKYDPSILPEESDPQKIRAQVEFYFGDTNLPTDNFMWTETDGTANKPISLKKIHAFGRMRRFQPYVAVVDALRHSSFLVVEGEEGEETVKRKVAYDPTIPRHKAVARSIYAKGFGEEEPSSQFDIEAFFAPYGPTNSVRLRRADDTKLFKGSVFVEFQDEETAEKFLALDSKPLWKGMHELEIKPKKVYMDGKTEEIKDGRMEPKETWASRGRGRGRGGPRDGNSGRRGDRRDRGDRNDHSDRGDRDPDDWKKRREEDRANGFKDGRNRDNDRKGRGRGGRGRRDRDERGSRDNDRNRERDEGVKKEDVKSKDVKAENIRAEDAPSKETVDTQSPPVNDKKRAREDDVASEAPSSKKADTKSDVPVEAS
ncbi:hypothetical protein G7Y89_g11337 [Cudoniella acicularis]|uniref:Uncharacterized protein n=1 Tax=Cudoniella acicularis TaxID=354080 RepID=A0A8H4W076_9HELO|nr:hypothetical protein G7Y89_g11337 [Cudoniella acicularis]